MSTLMSRLSCHGRKFDYSGIVIGERGARTATPQGLRPTLIDFTGVRLATVADYFLITYQGGALINNITHHVKPAAGAQEFARKEVAALMGVRSKIESLLPKIGRWPPAADSRA